MYKGTNAENTAQSEQFLPANLKGLTQDIKKGVLTYKHFNKFSYLKNFANLHEMQKDLQYS
jgi:hypothetical protein